jgi:chemotaxis protein methyltransferase WspC
MHGHKHDDPRFAAWLLQETGIDAESLGANALARAVAARAALTVTPGADAEALAVPPTAHAAARTHHAIPAQWEGGTAMPEAVRDAYWTRLTSEVAERQALIDALVVPETWFFREREAFAALARGGVQRLAAQPGELVRVLSVPCSTGEEPYSAAMALIDAGLAHEQFGIEAIDISAASIEAAARAVYGRNAFRGDVLAFRERYFHPTPDGWQLADAARRAVSFERANLFDWLAAHPVRYDFIFCRNVLIYFDREAQDRAIGLLRARLAEGGMIFVGPAETGLMMRHEFTSAQIPLAFGFTAPGEGARYAARGLETLPSVQAAIGLTAVATAGLATPGVATPGTMAATAAPAAPHALRPLHGAPPARTGDAFAAHIAAARSATIGAVGTPPGARAASSWASGAAMPGLAAPVAPLRAVVGSSIKAAASPAVATLAAARRLADAGALDEAAQTAAQVAQASPQDAEAWYLLGLIADARGQGEQALAHYRKALYLEPGHYEALTHLAALLEVQGDADGARRLMRRAERAAQRLQGVQGQRGVDA